MEQNKIKIKKLVPIHKESSKSRRKTLINNKMDKAGEVTISNKHGEPDVIIDEDLKKKISSALSNYIKEHCTKGGSKDISPIHTSRQDLNSV